MSVREILRRLRSCLALAVLACVAACAGAPSAPGLDQGPLAERAKSGDVSAQIELAQQYLANTTVPTDRSVGVEWMRKAAISGSADAELKLGQLYYSGVGVPQSYSDAYAWFHKAASQGDGLAEGNLCYMNNAGQGTQQDYAQGKSWCDLGIQQGDHASEVYLALMYIAGNGVGKDPAEGMKLLTDAAGHGYHQADGILARMYYWGLGSVTKDYAAALKWAQEGADGQDPESDYLLGHMYHRGLGVPKDDYLAAQYDALAAERSYAPAEVDLAYLYSSGKGVSKDMDKAHALLRQALKQGDMRAGWQLAQMHFFDGDTTIDDAQAMAYYDACIKTSDVDCINSKAWIMATSTKQALHDPVSAEALAKQAVERSPTDASYMDTLAAAYASQKRFPEAVTEEQSALDNVPSDADHAEERQNFTERLALYQSGKTYTDPRQAKADGSN